MISYDNLQSFCNKKEIRHSKRYWMKKAALRIQLKIRNLVADLHKKIVKWLYNSCGLILLPLSGTKGMIRRLSRKISAGTIGPMLTWAHYRFKQRLLFKSIHGARCSFAMRLIHPSHVVVVVNSIEHLERRKCLFAQLVIGS
jgi:putative transposase